MMKILWLCNVVLPELAEEFGFKKQYFGGWLTGAWNELKLRSDLELAICVPVRNPSRCKDGVFSNYRYYSFLTISKESTTEGLDQIKRFKYILNDFKPDVIHIWGTEYEHSYSMVRACEENGLLRHAVVGIQGLLTYCGKVYDYGIPKRVLNQKVNSISINDNKKVFMEKSNNEKKILETILNVSGRTDWDRGCINDINPDAVYYYCGPILRETFYLAPKWKKSEAVKQRIFMSQASYPIKGLHLIIEELSKLADIYNDLEVRIAGEDILSKQNAYGIYINKLLNKYRLEGKVHFIGIIDEEKMIKEYLNANVFLSSSLIENESNSICEAMLLGVPVVSSFVGGIGTVVDNGKNGLLYPLNEPYMMKYYIQQIFDERINLDNLSKEEINKASHFNNKEVIMAQIFNMYEKISSK